MNKKSRWIKSTPSQRARERLISEALRSQSVGDFKDESEYLFKVNHYLMEKILKKCPSKHLIVVTYLGRSADSNFEENKNNLLAKVHPDDTCCTDCNSSIMCFNPQNCSDATWAIEKFTSEFTSPCGTILFWEFVPYPEHWS